MKYKQRFKWKREGAHGYWEELWTCPAAHRIEICLLAVSERGYYISPTVDQYWGLQFDHGPYPDLPTAKSVAETYITLNQAPDFSKPFKRPRRKREVK